MKKLLSNAVRGALVALALFLAGLLLFHLWGWIGLALELMLVCGAAAGAIMGIGEDDN